MKLQEIFEQLSNGEFSQLSIGGAAQGVLDSTNYHKVTGHISLGLTALFTRFNLKEGRVKVRLLADKTSYLLHSDYSVVSTRHPLASRYILDAAGARFMDDLLKIERVLTESGVEMYLNNVGQPYSVTTPTNKTLRVPAVMVTDGAEVPDDLDTETLEVVYRANHPKLSYVGDLSHPAHTEIELPDSHLQALLYFVASRVHTPVGMANEGNTGNTYYMKYEAECLTLEGKGMQIDQGGMNDRLTRNGWV